jgi:hypothetical protein
LIFSQSEWLEYALKGRLPDLGRGDLIRRYLATDNAARAKMTETRRALYRLEVQLPREDMGDEWALELEALLSAWQQRTFGREGSKAASSTLGLLLKLLLLIGLGLALVIWKS